jgi:membrane protein implicated in regulation of membrane protease activity
MSEILSQWPTIDVVFLACAIAGGAAFLIWIAMQFMGADLDTDADIGTDFDASEVSGSADVSFTLLSFQGLSSFFTMFGLVGLAAHREGEVNTFWSVGVASLAGFTMTWVVARLFKMFNRLQSSGTLKMESAVGQEATIYLTVPESGEGKVQLTMQGRFQVLPAVADGDESLETGTRVLVVRVNDERTLVVTKL